MKKVPQKTEVKSLEVRIHPGKKEKYSLTIGDKEYIFFSKEELEDSFFLHFSLGKENYVDRGFSTSFVELLKQHWERIDKKEKEKIEKYAQIKTEYKDALSQIHRLNKRIEKLEALLNENDSEAIKAENVLLKKKLDVVNLLYKIATTKKNENESE